MQKPGCEIHLYIHGKKSEYKWTCAIQTHVVQESTVLKMYEVGMKCKKLENNTINKNRVKRRNKIIYSKRILKVV